MLHKLFTNPVSRDFILSGFIIASLYGVTHNPVVRPLPEHIPGKWTIQFMQHPLLFGFAGHNYLELRNATGTIVAELHGLATDPETGAWKYIGKKTDELKVWEFEEGRYIAGSGFPGMVLVEGTEAEMRSVWEKGAACKQPINELRIPYPSFGFNMRTETLNSNSVAYTLALCMGLDIKHLGLWTPGSTMNLLEK